MTRSAFDSAPAALRATFAGRARVTLVSKKTGDRYTFRVSKAKKPSRDGSPFFFVSLLVGSSNEGDFAYLGGFRGEEGARRFFGSRKPSASKKAQGAIEWAVRKLAEGEIPSTLEVWHEGRCCACGRALTVPESIATGFGPTCSKRLGISQPKATKPAPAPAPEKDEESERAFAARVARKAAHAAAEKAQEERAARSKQTRDAALAAVDFRIVCAIDSGYEVVAVSGGRLDSDGRSAE